MKPLTDAQRQAERIVTRAKRDAAAITARARAEAQKIREREMQRRARNYERAVEITEQAKEIREKAVRLFRINLANTLTLFNGVSGFFSILASMQYHFILASSLILAGVLFDWLDGKAARRFGEESPLGRELDSLSDLITFGLAPAVLVARIHPSFLAYFAGGVFVLSAALRLGRFNVQELKGVYFGVPTTMNGILLPAFVYLGLVPFLFPWYLLLMALLMNAPLRIKKVF